MSIEQCQKILKKGKRKLTSEEVALIREILYAVAAIQIENESIN
jgi:hypothetical protein